MSNDNRNNVKENAEQYLLMFFCGILLTKLTWDETDRELLVCDVAFLEALLCCHISFDPCGIATVLSGALRAL